MASMALDNEGSKTNVEKHSEGVINLPATNNTTTNNFNYNDNNNNNNIKSKSDIDIQANNSNRKVLLRVKRKRGDDPLAALIIQERVKMPKKSKIEINEIEGGKPLLTNENDNKITVKEEEKAFLLFRRLGTVAADDVGITHKKASKLLRKFKEIEKKRSRSKARQSRGVDEDISWYGNNDKRIFEDNYTNNDIHSNFENGIGADDRKKRIATNARNGRKKRNSLLSKRRKSNLMKNGSNNSNSNSSGGGGGNNVSFNDTFDVMDIEPKRNNEKNKHENNGSKKLDNVAKTITTQSVANVPPKESKDTKMKTSIVVPKPIGVKIMTPLDTMMDKAIFRSFREGPRFCNLIMDALNQGCNANFVRYQADKTTALMAACLHGRGDIVIRLIESGSDMKLLDNEDRSAVDFAKIGKHFDIVTELMQLGGLTGAEIVRQRKEAEEKSQYVYDYYYLKGVAADDVNNNSGNKDMNNSNGMDVGSSNTTINSNQDNSITSSTFSNSAILDITTKYQSKFLRAADSNSYVSYENAEHLFSDATNPKDQYFGLEEFQYENDAHDLSELEDSDDSNAENYFENDYADSDPGILFTSEEEDDRENQYHDDYDDERCIIMDDGDDYYY